MHKILGMILVGFGLIASFPPAFAQHETALAEAKQEAAAWLQLTDTGKYDASWEQASNPFRGSVSMLQWNGALQQVRTPLGEMKKRELVAANYTENLPGMPKGEYVVIRYHTEFAVKSGASESVAELLDKDGKWRVVGYFIQ